MKKGVIMVAQQLENFRKNLSNILVLAEASDLKNLCQTEIKIDQDGDEADQVMKDRLQNMALRLQGREESYLNKVKAALARMESGTYGECVLCGCRINHKRLEARPTAHYCIECKEDQEKDESNLFSNKKNRSTVYAIPHKVAIG